MGLHVGGIYIQADKKKTTQDTVTDFIRDYWLKLGAKESQNDPLEFQSLNIEKTGRLGFAIGPAKEDAEGNLFIGIYDSERYRADAALARALAHHFNNEAWIYEVTDSVNQAYVKKYGKKEEMIKKYDKALEKIESFPYSLLYFDKLKEELSKEDLKKFKFLAFESIPHRPKAQYSGPSAKQLDSNDLVVQAKKYAGERNAEELLKIADNHDVYYDVIDDLLESADPSNPEELAFLSKMAHWSIEKDHVFCSIVETALRLKDEKMFEKALKNMKGYKLYTLEGRAREIGDRGENYLAFRLMEAYAFRDKYQDPQLLNNVIHFLDRTMEQIGITSIRLKELLKKAYEAAPINPYIYHNLACVYVKMKQYDKAMDCVLEAVKYGYPELDLLKNDPDLDPIRSDKRFIEAFNQKPELISLDHLKTFKNGEPWITPSIGLHLYFKKEEARIGAAELLQKLFEEFPKMFAYYLRSGYIELFPTPKGKVQRDITLLKKGGSKYGYTLYYNSIKRGGASEERFIMELDDERNGEISIQLPLGLADDPEKLYERLIEYASKLPFVSGNAGYSFCAYYEGNGAPEEDLFRLLEMYWGFTVSQKSLHLAPKIKPFIPNWLTFIGPEIAKKLDLKKIPSDRIQTLKNKSVVIRAAEKPFIGLCSNPSDLDLLPKVMKVLKPFLPQVSQQDYYGYFNMEAKRSKKIMNLENK